MTPLPHPGDVATLAQTDPDRAETLARCGLAAMAVGSPDVPYYVAYVLVALLDEQFGRQGWWRLDEFVRECDNSR